MTGEIRGCGRNVEKGRAVFVKNPGVVSDVKGVVLDIVERRRIGIGVGE